MAPAPASLLIVEDDPLTAELVTTIVHYACYVPLVAESGQQTLELARSCAPKPGDYRTTLPRMRGEAPIPVLHEEWDADLPVVLVSAAPLSHLLAAVADAVLPKPVRAVDLRELLNRCLAA